MKSNVIVNMLKIILILFTMCSCANGNGTSIGGVGTNICEEILEGTNGSFTSPDWPHLYPLNIICYYQIYVPTNQFVQLEFTSFQIEETTNCQYDKVDIFDEIWGSYGTFCGSIIPGPIISIGSNLTVQFVSDSVINDNGFQAIYNAVDEGPEQISTTNSGVSTEPTLNNHPSVGQSAPAYICPEDITADSGSVNSPNFPLAYPHNAVCNTKITVSDEKQIKLEFTSFDIEGSPTCEYDSVTVYEISQVYGTFCGYIKPSIIISQSNSLNVHFSSDQIQEYGGFEATFVAVTVDESSQVNKTEPGTTGKTLGEFTEKSSTSMINGGEERPKPVEDASNDLLTIMLVTFGVILVLAVVAVITGVAFCKYTKDKVTSLSKKPSKKKRKVIQVRELPVWSTMKKMPPVGTHIPDADNIKVDFSVVDM